MRGDASALCAGLLYTGRDRVFTWSHTCTGSLTPTATRSADARTNTNRYSLSLDHTTHRASALLRAPPQRHRPIAEEHRLTRASPGSPAQGEWPADSHRHPARHTRRTRPRHAQHRAPRRRARSASLPRCSRSTTPCSTAMATTTAYAGSSATRDGAAAHRASANPSRSTTRHDRRCHYRQRSASQRPPETRRPAPAVSAPGRWSCAAVHSSRTACHGGPQSGPQGAPSLPVLRVPPAAAAAAAVVVVVVAVVVDVVAISHTYVIL